jgi:hypothetical protein
VATLKEGTLASKTESLNASNVAKIAFRFVLIIGVVNCSPI